MSRIADIWAAADYAVGYDVTNEGFLAPAPQPTQVGYFLIGLWHEIRYGIVAAAICRWKGHDLVVESHVSPDSASEDWECRRCGAGGTHTYF